jgi:TRAP-type C4-dicarboxylate transport system permease small subunit
MFKEYFFHKMQSLDFDVKNKKIDVKQQRKRVRSQVWNICNIVCCILCFLFLLFIIIYSLVTY